MFNFMVKILLATCILYPSVHISGLSAFLHTNDVVESVAPEIELRALPALRFDGVCPKKAAKCPTSFQDTHPLIMISLDGFHPDYMNRGVTPTISNIARCGTHARFMYPVFPSKTFPNHYSQVTGVNPASHGIIDNNMYDPLSHQLFKFGRPESLQPFWWEKEPLWATARKQGKISASFFWPGSDINGTLPTYVKKYNSKLTFEDRVDQVLAWLDLPVASRPHFITMYANQPDHAGHKFGVKSKQVNEALVKVDHMISRLYSGLQQRNLVNCVNIVIVSDHGMSDTDCKRVVYIQKYMNVSNVYTTVGPFGRLRPKGKRNITVINDMVSKLRCQSPQMRVYLKEQLPVRMHYADHIRIDPIFLDIDAGWTVVSKDVEPPYSGICSGAAHGYDNMYPDMRSIFIAQGPAFKKNYTTRPFISTELYEMLSELINVTPNPNNGTRGSMHHAMTSFHKLQQQIEPDSPAVGHVPQDDIEYKFRLYASNCSCSPAKRQTQDQDTAVLRDLHLPFGVPYSREDNTTLRLLYNRDYVTAFDLKYRIPMWSAFTLKGQINVTKVKDVCWKGDARIQINDAAKCSDYNAKAVKKNSILQRPLYYPGFLNSSNSEQATFVTNSIPKSLDHYEILEKPMNQILARWASESGELNVITGPAFDLYATGIKPPTGRLMKLHEQNGPLVVPTHLFVIATWCSMKGSSLKTCNPSKLEAHAFLLPNQPYSNNCEPAESVISKNVARVVDIENLTGISFYTGLPVYDAIRLRTTMPERSL